MPTRTKYVEIVNIVTFSENLLHHCLCESRGFKIVRSSYRRKEDFNKKGVLKNFEKFEKLSESGAGFFPAKFTNFLRILFLQKLLGDCF